MYYVYLLKSLKNGDTYIGFCEDLKIRFKRHNNGKVRSTKPYVPWILVYYEAYRSKKDAAGREKQLKNNHKAKSDLLKQAERSLES